MGFDSVDKFVGTPIRDNQGLSINICQSLVIIFTTFTTLTTSVFN